MGTRSPHMLYKPDGSKRPTNVVFFDTETNYENNVNGGFTHSLKLGIAWHTRTTRGERLRKQSECLFRGSGEFWSYVDRCCRERSTTYITAHNIVFDLAVTNGFVELAARGWTLQSFYTKGIVSLFRWKNGTRKLIGMDNTNLFAGKLSQWGDLFGYPKLDVEFDTVSDEDLIVYCRRDVEIMYRSWLAWLEFLDDNDCGDFRVTVGSTAISTWKHRFMQHRVHIHDNELALSMERESYRGGRVECFYQGVRDDGPFYYLDINNMYGYVLKRYMYPAGIWDAKVTDSLSILARKLDGYAVTARVTIDTPEPWFPYRIDGFTCYPVGRFTTTLTTPELMLCLRNGWLAGVHALAWYRQESLFSEFIRTFHALRVVYRHQGNRGFEKICKLMNNSLYGKFGQQGFVQKRIGDVDLFDVHTETVLDVESGEIYRHVALAGGLYEEHKTGESRDSFPAIAAHVTAYARLYLYRMARLAGQGHVYYCDTDSLIVDEQGKQNLSDMLDPDTLGALKIELESPWIEINAPKDYRMQNRTRIKGVSVSAESLGDGSYKQQQWVRLAGMIRGGDVGTYTTREVIKHQSRTIHSGVVTASGWVEPFVLGLEGSAPAPAESVRMPVSPR